MQPMDPNRNMKMGLALMKQIKDMQRPAAPSAGAGQPGGGGLISTLMQNNPNGLLGAIFGKGGGAVDPLTAMQGGMPGMAPGGPMMPNVGDGMGFDPSKFGLLGAMGGTGAGIDLGGANPFMLGHGFGGF